VAAVHRLRRSALSHHEKGENSDLGVAQQGVETEGDIWAGEGGICSNFRCRTGRKGEGEQSAPITMCQVGRKKRRTELPAEQGDSFQLCPAREGTVEKLPSMATSSSPKRRS